MTGLSLYFLVILRCALTPDGALDLDAACRKFTFNPAVPLDVCEELAGHFIREDGGDPRQYAWTCLPQGSKREWRS